jgi:thiosulfate reductase cytochrome b subunit
MAGTPVSSTNKTYHHDITEILLKMPLNTITLILIFNVFLPILVASGLAPTCSSMVGVISEGLTALRNK